jgi:formyltetrahydrofolate synthetase
MLRKLERVDTPTPSDLHIAQAFVPLPISHIAQELGLTDEDYDLHGKLKAKARARLCRR